MTTTGDTRSNDTTSTPPGVWVLTHRVAYEGTEILGVFTTPENAKGHVQPPSPGSDREWWGNGMHGYTSDADGGSFEIEHWPLDPARVPA